MPMLINDKFAGVGLLGGGLKHVNEIIPTLAQLISFILGGAME